MKFAVIFKWEKFGVHRMGWLGAPSPAYPARHQATASWAQRPTVSDAGWLCRVHPAAKFRVPKILIQLKLLQTSEININSNTSQKNVNELPKCSVKQTLPTGIIGQLN